jgi:hypothetical protein
MKNELVLDPSVLEEFQKQAKRERQNPGELLTEYMQECLDSWEFNRLFKELRRDLRKSGYEEEDAVELVRKFRRAKKAKAARSKGATA